ncbi:Peptidoglycan-binding Lysin subgroup [Penicillium cf. griseofulvum]|uniref:Peptidoglycan-binding Lysin subgroup n=1 Tax=Penicillium cf. griseofulvum TaxID=2972120 RepID=A0A9W9T628_9EURO|nr:Peptidoglycan-binding Lysin subgroup [Penicillium cf. griseofulvum]KAJ5422273.1 Peptidoglycan-binding Lysin subgroup [Penicillium cf. griseofulvum]
MRSFQGSGFLALCCLGMIHRSVAWTTTTSSLSPIQTYAIKETCFSVLVGTEDTCDTLPVKCGIPVTSFTSFNPNLACSSLPKGKPVCCDNGTRTFPPKSRTGWCYTHTVRNGDTCEKIAEGYKVTKANIETWNTNTTAWYGCNDLQNGGQVCVSKGDPPMPVAIRDAVCGPQVPGTGRPKMWFMIADLNPCPAGQCCSRKGQCGTGEDFCGKSALAVPAPPAGWDAPKPVNKAASISEATSGRTTPEAEAAPTIESTSTKTAVSLVAKSLSKTNKNPHFFTADIPLKDVPLTFYHPPTTATASYSIVIPDSAFAAWKVMKHFMTEVNNADATEATATTKSSTTTKATATTSKTTAKATIKETKTKNNITKTVNGIATVPSGWELRMWDKKGCTGDYVILQGHNKDQWDGDCDQFGKDIMGRQADPASSASVHSLDDVPPPYTDLEPIFAPVEPVQPVQPAQPPTSIRPLLLVSSAYILPGSKNVKPDDKVSLTIEPALSSNCNELYHVIRQQIKLPPRPLLYIHGTHTESSNDKKSKSNSANTVTDFRFKLDLAETMLRGWEGEYTSTIWREIEILTDEDRKQAYRGGIFRSDTYKPPKSRAAISLGGDDDPLLARENDDDYNFPDAKNLRMWCERFCRDPASLKSFTLHRQVSGFDSNAMGNVLASHIRELNYRGSVSFNLSVAHRSVTIYSPHWINQLRHNNFVWWVVVLLQLWIITWPVIFFMEKRYEVVHTRWFSSLLESSDSPLTKCYALGRDECSLAEYWAPAVKQAAWTRRQGEGDLLTRMDADRLKGHTTSQLLGLRAETSGAELERRQRVNSGEAGLVDNLVGLVRGVGGVVEDWRLSSGWGANS